MCSSGDDVAPTFSLPPLPVGGSPTLTNREGTEPHSKVGTPPYHFAKTRKNLREIHV